MSKRLMTEYEMSEARKVFAQSLDFNQISIHEEIQWPDRLAKLGSLFHRTEPPTHNAVTLGNHIYFPIELQTAEVKDMAWLVHELMHCWQFQHRGIRYLLEALSAQWRLGPSAYAYGWKAGLKTALDQGKSFDDFNPEQQGEIARHFYYRLINDLDVQPWQPWIQAIQIRGR